MTLREIARQAATDTVDSFMEDDRERLVEVIADAVAIAVLREGVARLRQWGEDQATHVLYEMAGEFDAPGAQERTTEKEDHGAGLIHQAIPDVDGTEPRLNADDVRELLAIASEVATWRDCDEEPSKCESQSGPYCGAHGENYLHKELTARARMMIQKIVPP